MRYFVMAYGGAAYLISLAVFLYLILFVAGILVPKTIDSGVVAPFGTAAAVNMALLALFGVQHTVMARPGFKALWTTLVPKPIERSTYVLLSSLVLIFLMWQWEPMPGAVWRIDNGVLAGLVWAVFVLGWLVVFASTFAIDHWDLFGLRQVLAFFRGRIPASPPYVERWFYKLVRHPLMLGFVIAFWAAPVMSEGRLLFAAGMTVYILIAIYFEERDLVAAHGDQYKEYQRRVSMLMPFPKRRPKGDAQQGETGDDAAKTA